MPSNKTLLASLIFSLAILAAATPTPPPDADAGVGNGSSGICGANTLQCCLGLMPANGTAASALLDAVGEVVRDVSSLVGLACTPLDGASGVDKACVENRAVCCSGRNALAGLVSLGCLPIPL
ncbi:hypothetical protein C8Q77DRAFT_1068222 [Trametes polyzona]|nr:hypothetical protein C8Q77DRAFT_1068222 [Trametes polyzona]